MPLDARDDEVEQQREHRQHEDTGDHCVDVEYAFGLQDQVADAFRRAEVFADDGADVCRLENTHDVADGR